MKLHSPLNQKIMSSLFRAVKTSFVGIVILLIFYLVASDTFFGKVFVAEEDAIYQHEQGDFLCLRENSSTLYFLIPGDYSVWTQLRLEQNWSTWNSYRSHWHRLLRQTWGTDSFVASYTGSCCESNNIPCREGLKAKIRIDIVITPDMVLIGDDLYMKTSYKRELWRKGVECNN